MTTTAVSILTATVSGLFVAIPSIITTVMTANAREKVQEERMKQMGEKNPAFKVVMVLHLF